MKKFLRPLVLLVSAAFLGACVSPYQAEMHALHRAYLAGNVSESGYHDNMTRLQMYDAGWQQQNANTAAMVAVGAAAIGAAALLSDNHHHHHRHHGNWHRHCR